MEKFDTLQASEELQDTGLTSQQVKAISLLVRKSHEVADIATKVDIRELKHDISDIRTEIAEVRKDIAKIDKRLDFLETRFYKLEQKCNLILWFLLAGILCLLFKEIMPKLFGS
ncbi:hypothetical protein [Arsenophonus nasoniae]|uniref:DUF1640 domain-containing protein n=1 Tax=Arsenophonus nasoniae TaxID=638 RepID=A0AA95GWP8_9GAMM|nr:hypothetical protein [Arsenophonus nasoniae]WGM02500.1 hypothetical protein QE210_05290 [Arsenophonus nasoniae]